MWVVRSSISVFRRREKEAERESPSSLAEVVGVYPLHLVGALQRYAHAVVDHEVPSLSPTDGITFIGGSLAFLKGPTYNPGVGMKVAFLTF